MNILVDPSFALSERNTCRAVRQPQFQLGLVGAENGSLRRVDTGQRPLLAQADVFPAEQNAFILPLSATFPHPGGSRFNEK